MCLVCQLIDAARDQDFTVIGLDTVQLTLQQARAYLQHHAPLVTEVDNYRADDSVAQYLSSAPVYVVAFQRANAISRMKKLLEVGGKTVSTASRTGSVRFVGILAWPHFTLFEFGTELILRV